MAVTYLFLLLRCNGSDVVDDILRCRLHVQIIGSLALVDLSKSMGVERSKISQCTREYEDVSLLIAL